MIVNYTTQTRAAIGDIIRVSYPACYAEVVDIQPISNPNYAEHNLKLKKICTTSFIFFKKQRVIQRHCYDIPYKIEKDSFNEYLLNVHKLLSMVK